MNHDTQPNPLGVDCSKLYCLSKKKNLNHILKIVEMCVSWFEYLIIKIICSHMRGSWFLSISTWQLKILINFRFVLWILGISVVKGIWLPNPPYFNFLFNFLNKKESDYNTCWRKNQLCYAHRLIPPLHSLLCQTGSISPSIPLGPYLVPNKCLNGHDDC